ncbi:MAG: pilin [Patescibacteria group bacterium]|nr:pilin [Patescibacteria group bacterium]
MKNIKSKISLIGIGLCLPILLSGCSLWSVLGITDPTAITSDDIARIVWKAVVFAGGIFGTIAVIMLIYGGIQYMTAMGNEQNMEKAKNTILWTVVALVIVTLAGLFISYLMNNILGVTWAPKT